MPTLNNEVVQINDKVYDISNGAGTVSALSEKTIEVLFANGRRLTFNNHGQIDGIRRLFWHYPLFIDPPKEKAQWDKIVRTMSTLYTTLEDFCS